MANMLYNGVELPDIETVWTDKETYPYAHITYFDTGDAESSGGVIAFTSQPVQYKAVDTNTGGPVSFIVAGTSYSVYEVAAGDSEWTHIQDGGPVSADVGFNSLDDVSNLTWSNHDILDADDGSVVLAASEPVDPNATPVDTLLYNGLPLPDISTAWDKTTHPFATIEQSIVGGEVTGEYAVIFSAEKGAVGEDGTDYEDTLVIGGEWVKYRYNPDLGFTEWTEQTDNVTFDGDAEVAVLDLVWVNYDVPDGDGTTFLKTSDPLDPEAELVKGQIYKYNGVELGLLPEVTTDFPYLYLVQVQEAYESATTFKYALFVSTHRAVYDPDADNVVVPTVSDGYYMSRGYQVAHDDDRFVWDSFTQDGGTDLSLTFDGVAALLWSNTDILNSSDGSVYFASTKAVKVGGLHLPSYWAGFVFGMVTPEFKSKSGMYSYNGVVLPALPKWDKEAYPYAVICTNGVLGSTLLVSKTYLRVEDYYGNDVITWDGLDLCWKTDANNGDWTEHEYAGERHTFSTGLWSNHDLYKGDTLYLAKSAPIPV